MKDINFDDDEDFTFDDGDEFEDLSDLGDLSDLIADDLRSRLRDIDQ